MILLNIQNKIDNNQIKEAGVFDDFSRENG